MRQEKEPRSKTDQGQETDWGLEMCPGLEPELENRCSGNWYGKIKTRAISDTIC